MYYIILYLDYGFTKREWGAQKKRENASLSVEVNTLRAIIDAMTNRSGSQEEALDQRQM